MENIICLDPGESFQFPLTQSVEALVLPFLESHYAIMLTSFPPLFLLKPVLVSCIFLEIFPFHLKFLICCYYEGIYNILLSFLTMSEYKVIFSFSVLILGIDTFSYLLNQFHQKFIYLTSSLKKARFGFGFVDFLFSVCILVH